MPVTFPMPQNVIPKTGEFVSARASTGSFSVGTWNPLAGTGGNPAGVSIEVSPEMPYRRIYLAVAFSGTGLADTGLRLRLEYSYHGKILRTDRFAWQQKYNATTDPDQPLPPYTVQEVDDTAIAANPAPLVGGDLPEQLQITFASILGFAKICRMTPFRTFQRCDKIALFGEAYLSAGTIPGAWMYLGAHSSVVNV
jgi:hypothetical protein